MSDLIERQAAIDALCRGEGCGNICRRALEHLPSAQPEVRTEMSSPDDLISYSDVIFDPGLVCFNANNHNYCVVINGRKGDANDRGSLVIEFAGDRGIMIHTPPNRALRPTGKIVDIRRIKKLLEEELA